MISFYIKKSVEHIDKNINAIEELGFSKKDSVSIAKDASDIARNFIQISAVVVVTLLYLYGIGAVSIYMSINNIPKIDNDGSLSLYFSIAVAAILYLIISCMFLCLFLVMSYIFYKFVSININIKNKAIKLIITFLIIFAPSNIFMILVFSGSSFPLSVFYAVILYFISLSLISEIKTSVRKGFLAAAALLTINIMPFPFLIVMIKMTGGESIEVYPLVFNTLYFIFYINFCISVVYGAKMGKTKCEFLLYVIRHDISLIIFFMVCFIYNFADISISILGHSLPYPVKVTSTRPETIINLDNPVCVVFNGDKMIYLRQATSRDEQSPDGEFVCKPPSENTPPTVGIKSDAVTSIQKYKPPASPGSP